MKLETKIYADALLSEVKAYVARELGEVKARSASVERVGELMMQIVRLEARVEALERERARGSKTARVVRLG